MNKWRPPGWCVNKQKQADTNCSGVMDKHFQHSTINEARHYLYGYEDGADAMLEALFELARQSPTGKFEIDSNEYHIYGIDYEAIKPRASGYEDKLPTIQQLVGSDPNYTGEMSTDDYLRSIRDEH